MGILKFGPNVSEEYQETEVEKLVENYLKERNISLRPAKSIYLASFSDDAIIQRKASKQGFSLDYGRWLPEGNNCDILDFFQAKKLVPTQDILEWISNPDVYHEFITINKVSKGSHDIFSIDIIIRKNKLDTLYVYPPGNHDFDDVSIAVTTTILNDSLADLISRPITSTEIKQGVIEALQQRGLDGDYASLIKGMVTYAIHFDR